MNHACKRALSRYGMEMTTEELKALALKIERGQARRVNGGAYGAQRWFVMWEKLGEEIPVVYLPSVQKIATVLPRSHFTRGPRFRELDVDWIEEDGDERFDAEALANLPVNALAPCENPIMAERLREALGS